MATRVRRGLLELVDVVVPETIEIGERYIAKVKIKNTATFWPTIYRYNSTVDGDKVEVKGDRDTVIKAGEEKEIEIERVAKKDEEHWEVEVYLGITPRMDEYTDPQFTEEFDVPKAVVPPLEIEVTGFEITDPVGKEIYAGGEFTGKTTIKNTGTAVVESVTVKAKQYKGDPASPERTWLLGTTLFTNVAAGAEVSAETVFTEGSGAADEYPVCAML